MDWILPPGMQVNLPEVETLGLFLLKILFLIGFLLYSVFAFVVIRQVRLMGQTYTTSLGSVLSIFAWAHFIVAVIVFVFALLIL